MEFSATLNLKRMLNVKFVFFLVAILLSVDEISGDRYCKISGQEKCGATLKGGQCDVVSLESYDYFMDDFDLISMAEHKATILNYFNKVRNRMSWDLAKVNGFRTYGETHKAGWHKGMEILSETIAKRVYVKSAFCIRVEEYEFSHMVVSMQELNEYDQSKFLYAAIQHMTNFNITGGNTTRVSDTRDEWSGRTEYIIATNGIGCSLAAYKESQSPEAVANMHLHCVFNRQNVTNVNELGQSCQKCYGEYGCDSVFAYICGLFGFDFFSLIQ